MLIIAYIYSASRGKPGKTATRGNLAQNPCHIISGSIGMIHPFSLLPSIVPFFCFFPEGNLPHGTQESVRAFREGDYAGGITHDIGATLSFRLLLVMVAFPVRLKLKMFHAQK